MSDDGFPFTASAIRQPRRAIAADLPQRTPLPISGSCCVCGEPATRRVGGCSAVCDRHYRGYNVLNARGHANAIGIMQGLETNEGGTR